jgi:membrane-associated phospholipid phosphatase
VRAFKAALSAVALAICSFAVSESASAQSAAAAAAPAAPAPAALAPAASATAATPAPASSVDPMVIVAAPDAPSKPAAPQPPPGPPDPDAWQPVPDVPAHTKALPVTVSTDAPPPLVWKWSRFSTADYLISTAGGATTLAMAIVRPRPQHLIHGGLLFDDAVRNTLRASPLVNRYIFRDASDVGLSLTVSWPFVGDALTTAWWYRGSRDVAEQMALIDLETLAISGALQGATNVLVSRERPYGRNCGTDQLPSDAIDCANSGHYRSFFSGHSSFSFTSAALICVHHFENELLGAPWDAISCAGGYAVATTTATFRVVADMHYATDVLTGALLGTLVGYGVPLLHYRNHDPNASRTNTMQLHLVPAAGGIGLLGIF